MFYNEYFKSIRSSIICVSSFFTTEQTSKRSEATAAKETRVAWGKKCVAGGPNCAPWFQLQQDSTEWWWKMKNQWVTHSWGSKRKQVQLECVCTRCERDWKIVTLNVLGIDRAIHVVAKWTLMYYTVPVGTSQTKLFSLLPIHQEDIIYWGENKNSWFLNWAKLQCPGREWGPSETLVSEMRCCAELLWAWSLQITHLQQTPGNNPSAHWWSGGPLTSALRSHLFSTEQHFPVSKNHGAVSVLQETWKTLVFSRPFDTWCITIGCLPKDPSASLWDENLTAFQGMSRGHHCPFLIPFLWHPLLLFLPHSSHLIFSLLPVHSMHTPAIGPLHLPLPLPGMQYCHILTWLTPSPSSYLRPSVTFSMKLSLTTSF